MAELLLGFLIGALLMYWGYALLNRKKQKELTVQQSTMLLEKVRSVCKLISVEGDFAEIYRYENRKEHFMNLFSSKKKALIVINAKAHIGYDFKKLKVSADPDKQTIILGNFPPPEILSVEPELEFYDIRNDLFNAFTPADMTSLNKEAKALIREKVPESGLMDTARHEVTHQGSAVELTVKEFNLLRWFLLHPGDVHSSERLLEHVWDEHADPFTNTVRVTISNLRRKLSEASGNGQPIETIPGRGYRLRAGSCPTRSPRPRAATGSAPGWPSASPCQRCSSPRS